MNNIKRFLSQSLGSTGSDPASSSFYSSSGGSSIVLILIIIVVVFAVMMSGGVSSLLSGNIPSSITGTPIPDNNSGSTSPTTSPQASPSPTGPAWTLKNTPGQCKTVSNKAARVDNLVATGATGGYINIQVKNSSGNYSTVETKDFTPTNITYAIVLYSSLGFNTASWKVDLYQGGNVNSGVWSGGTLKATYNGNPTGC
jgi:hypothetical protein